MLKGYLVSLRYLDVEVVCQISIRIMLWKGLSRIASSMLPSSDRAALLQLSLGHLNGLQSGDIR